MFAGTGSDVGKSVIAAAFCRIFHQDGYSPAPFKAQNMALNSFATPEGLEIGRAQAAQAEAAGIACHTDMNPILLKPQSDHTSQVVLNGVPIGNRDAYSYFRGEGKDYLRREACEAFDRLALRYNPIVMEGAGSISELNLRERDIVNLPMARHADADVILVGDIDRGGVFASLYGSVMLQTPEDRQRIKGIIVNKFRGDLRLFDDGRRMIEEICQVPVLGVVPYLEDVGVEDEDSVVLDKKQRNAKEGKTNVAVVKIRHASDAIELQVSGPEPYLGPLSDAADSIQAWDALRSGKATPGQRRTIIEQLEASGLHVTEKGEDKVPSVSRDEPQSPAESAAVPSAPAYDEEPEGSLVEAPVGASTSLEDLKALVIRGLKEHLCTPAFARLAAREYGFNMEFQDPEMQRESLDEEELRKVEAYREAIRKDVSEAMRLFGEDHPARPQVNNYPQRRAPGRIPKMKAPDYDFSRLK